MILCSALVGCAAPEPTPVATPVLPDVSCRLPPATCDAAAAAVLAVLAVLADSPQQMFIVLEPGSFCPERLFDGVPCPDPSMAPGSTAIGRAEALFGNSYTSTFLNLATTGGRIVAVKVAEADRPQPDPTD